MAAAEARETWLLILTKRSTQLQNLCPPTTKWNAPRFKKSLYCALFLFCQLLCEVRRLCPSLGRGQRFYAPFLYCANVSGGPRESPFFLYSVAPMFLLSFFLPSLFSPLGLHFRGLFFFRHAAQTRMPGSQDNKKTKKQRTF
jgi:hypothetical protein